MTTANVSVVLKSHSCFQHILISNNGSLPAADPHLTAFVAGKLSWASIATYKWKGMDINQYSQNVKKDIPLK